MEKPELAFWPTRSFSPEQQWHAAHQLPACLPAPLQIILYGTSVQTLQCPPCTTLGAVSIPHQDLHSPQVWLQPSLNLFLPPLLSTPPPNTHTSTTLISLLGIAHVKVMQPRGPCTCSFICLTLRNWHLPIPLASIDITSPERSASHPPIPTLSCPALPITCHLILLFYLPAPFQGFPDGSDSKESACNAGDLGLIPGSGRSPGGGNGYPFWYSYPEYPMDRGAWQATVYGVAKSGTGWRTITSPPLQFSKLYYPFVCLSIVSICSW